MSFYKNRRDDTCAFVCDQCGDEYELDGTDFHDALEEVKENGWRARNEFGEWLHLCDCCA